MTIFDKENAILAGQVTLAAAVSQLSTAVQAIAATQTASVNLQPLQDAITAVDAHVGQVQALIGQDAAATPTPTPAASS